MYIYDLFPLLNIMFFDNANGIRTDAVGRSGWVVVQLAMLNSGPARLMALEAPPAWAGQLGGSGLPTCGWATIGPSKMALKISDEGGRAISIKAFLSAPYEVLEVRGTALTDNLYSSFAKRPLHSATARCYHVNKA